MLYRLDLCKAVNSNSFQGQKYLECIIEYGLSIYNTTGNTFLQSKNTTIGILDKKYLAIRMNKSNRYNNFLNSYDMHIKKE